MTLVCRRALPPIQPLLLSVKQGGIGYHFYSLWYDSAGARTADLLVSGRTLNHKATEPPLHALVLNDPSGFVKLSQYGIDCIHVRHANLSPFWVQMVHVYVHHREPMNMPAYHTAWLWAQKVTFVNYCPPEIRYMSIWKLNFSKLVGYISEDCEIP